MIPIEIEVTKGDGKKTEGNYPYGRATGRNGAFVPSLILVTPDSSYGDIGIDVLAKRSNRGNAPLWFDINLDTARVLRDALGQAIELIERGLS